jgi:pyruvate/2-oxoglutarate dehydrogenase complex dihydrolipoamide dehydrogenase (E3) component
MNRLPRVDLCVIGGGPGGLSVAAGAAQMGASVILVERGRMGGDCLNFGCVPSKALLAAGRTAQSILQSGRFGIEASIQPIDGKRVHKHVHDVIAGIAPHDSVERFEGLGVSVIRDHARFVAHDEIEAGGERLRARRFVIATGSSPLVPATPGLESVPFYTNETIFDLQELPTHLLIVGGGPIGVELGQAFRELGAEVMVIERGAILPRDDPELVAVLRVRLAALGVVIYENATIKQVDAAGDTIAATIMQDGSERQLAGTHILVAVGRRPTIADLDLETAGVAYSDEGIIVDRRLRTTNRRIFAIGDVTGGPRFTHVAGYHAGIVLRNALLHIPAKVDHRGVPHVTYTHPELAQVGATEAEARAVHRNIVVLRSPFSDNDRARAERTTEGLVKIVTDRRGRIIGAGIVGAMAGELIQTWVLAISRRLHVGALATIVAPYPTLGEANKQAAAKFYIEKLFSGRTRRIVRLLARFG